MNLSQAFAEQKIGVNPVGAVAQDGPALVFCVQAIDGRTRQIIKIIGSALS